MSAADWLWPVTNLGDVAVLAPASAVTVLWLALHRAWGEATALAAAFLACILATVTLKLGFSIAGLPAAGAGRSLGAALLNPSGHTSLSTCFYGSYALLLASRAATKARWAFGLAAALLILAIAVSRVVLGMHSVSDVLFGWLVGTGGIALFLALRRRSPAVAIRPALLSAVVLLAIAWDYGARFESNRLLTAALRLARRLF